MRSKSIPKTFKFLNKKYHFVNYVNDGNGVLLVITKTFSKHKKRWNYQCEEFYSLAFQLEIQKQLNKKAKDSL